MPEQACCWPCIRSVQEEESPTRFVSLSTSLCRRSLPRRADLRNQRRMVIVCLELHSTATSGAGQHVRHPRQHKRHTEYLYSSCSRVGPAEAARDIPAIGDAAQNDLALLGVQIRRVRVALICYRSADLAFCLDLLHKKSKTHHHDGVQVLHANPDLNRRLYRCLQMSAIALLHKSACCLCACKCR